MTESWVRQALDTKRNGGEVSASTWERLIDGYVAGTIGEAPIAALLMASAIRGLTAAETQALTEAMIRSGDDDGVRRDGRRQAFHRRRRRQRFADRRSGRRRVRREGGEAVGPRARPHRRHARQTRIDPRRSHRARARRIPRASRTHRVRDQRAERAPRSRRPAPLRSARSHRHDRERRIDCRIDRLEENRRRRDRDRVRREDRRGRVHGHARSGARTCDGDGRDHRTFRDAAHRR